ncbi:MAG: PAS domain-containing protein [Candidatus Jettenia sp.]|nr:MAG: PAS domain-containing protein [Candidatus Jettenia sp.]
MNRLKYVEFAPGVREIPNGLVLSEIFESNHSSLVQSSSIEPAKEPKSEGTEKRRNRKAKEPKSEGTEKRRNRKAKEPKSEGTVKKVIPLSQFIMNKKKPTGKKDNSLRRRAEEVLAGKIEKLKKIPFDDIKKLIHELQVYQIELEMQNEELRKAQSKIEESRSKYIDLYDFAPIGYCTMDKNGIIIEANLTLSSLLGVERKLLLRRPFAFFVMNGFKGYFFSHLQKVFASDDKQMCELNLMGKNGTRNSVFLESIATRDSEGTAFCRSAISNVTDRKQAEEALRISESTYRLLLESLPQRIFYKDRNFVYQSCNMNLANDLHIKPDEIRGKTDYDLYPIECAIKYRMVDTKVMKSGKVHETEETYTKDGKECVIHIVTTPVRDEKGYVVGILGIFWDITEKIALQKEAEHTRHLAALGELAAGVGHEINNPITGIINCAQILLNKSSEGSREKDIAGRIKKEGDRIAMIVNRLLMFAWPLNQEKKSRVKTYDIIKDTLILSEAQLRKEGIHLRVNIPQNLPELYAYPQQIEQVFLNIISNARYALNQKYPEHHDNKLLEITGEEITIDGLRYVRITFYDHGTGIPAGIKDKVMTPFFTTKPRGIGTGLGLSISHGIINDHGGKLLIESVDGKFTKVFIILPVIS